VAGNGGTCLIAAKRLLMGAPAEIDVSAWAIDGQRADQRPVSPHVAECSREKPLD